MPSICTLDYSSAMETNATVTYATAQMSPGNTELSETPGPPEPT